MAKTPSLNASIREVGISPTLKSVRDDLCRIILYVTNDPLRHSTADSDFQAQGYPSAGRAAHQPPLLQPPLPSPAFTDRHPAQPKFPV
jgi:hypothetical protein